MSAKTANKAEAATGRKRQPARRVWIIIAIFVLILALGTVAACLILKNQNDQAVVPIIGCWYSETEDLQYYFSADGTFEVTNNQTILMKGQWRVTWKKDTLKLTYLIEESARNSSSIYEFGNDNNMLLLLLDSNRQIVLKRIDDK